MNPKYLFFFVITFILCTGCTTLSKEDIKQLEGYWEIDSVKAHGETFSPKGSAPAIDHYTLVNDSVGFKKKLVPSFGEKYSSSEDLIQFRLVVKNGSYFIQFFNALQTWEEKITSISAEELILFHSEKTYHYKRHQKITLE